MLFAKLYLNARGTFYAIMGLPLRGNKCVDIAMGLMLPDKYSTRNKFKLKCQIVLNFRKICASLIQNYMQFSFKSIFVFLRYINLMLIFLFYKVATFNTCAKCCRTSEIFPSGQVKRKTIISNLQTLQTKCQFNACIKYRANYV